MDTDGDGYLTRKEFLCIPELTINPLCDRIIHAFFCDGEASQDPNLAQSEEQAEEADKSNQDVITFPDFVKVLAKFKPIDKVEENNKLNSREERLKCKNFCYLPFLGIFLSNLFQLLFACTIWMAMVSLPKKNSLPC